MTLFLIFKGNEERRDVSFDSLAVISLLIGFPSLLIALTRGTRFGWHVSEIMLWFGLAAAGMLGFVWRELHAESPLMNLRYFRNIALP